MPAFLLAAGVLATGICACKKRHPVAKHKKHQTGYPSVDALGRGVFDAIQSKTLFRVRQLFPTAALYKRYFTCSKNPISGMGRYHADGLYGVMRHKTQHGKVVVKTIRAEQSMTKIMGETIGPCRFVEDVPHKLLTVTYTYQAADIPGGPSPAGADPKLSLKLGSWTFVTTQLAGRWYLFIILAMDGKPIDEIGLPVKAPTDPPARARPE